MIWCFTLDYFSNKFRCFLGSCDRTPVRNAYFSFAVGIKLYAAASGVAGRPEFHAVGATDWVKCPLRTVTSGTTRRRTRAENKITAGKIELKNIGDLFGVDAEDCGWWDSLVCWCLLPRRKDPIDLLGGAAKEQQWQRGEQADQDGTCTQLAGAADRKFQPSHHHSSQDGAQYCHWDTDSSWRGSDMQSASAPLCNLKPLKTSHRSAWWTRRPSGWTVSQWTWPWRWRGRPAVLPGSPGPGLPAGRRGSASFAAQREENLIGGDGG